MPKFRVQVCHALQSQMIEGTPTWGRTNTYVCMCSRFVLMLCVSTHRCRSQAPMLQAGVAKVSTGRFARRLAVVSCAISLSFLV